MRKNRPKRILGPYRERDGWRVILVEAGVRTSTKTLSEEDAWRVKQELERELESCERERVSSLVTRYLEALSKKGNKQSSIDVTAIRIKSMLHGLEHIHELTPSRAQKLYDSLCARTSRATGRSLRVDTHRNTLAEAKTFGRWCVKVGVLKKNPFESVEPSGRRSHGKTQLRIDEARAFCRTAHDLAEQGDVGAVVALVALLMGLRASEIIQRVGRDVDDGGRLLWIPCAKTKAGRRQVEIPSELQPYFRELSQRAPGELRLFGDHLRDWPRRQVLRICRLARVPPVCAHSMRGLHSTLAIAAGQSPHAVAKSLGHHNASVTLQSYALPGTGQQAIAARALHRLRGSNNGPG